jgi:hypothetical protein
MAEAELDEHPSNTVGYDSKGGEGDAPEIQAAASLKVKEYEDEEFDGVVQGQDRGDLRGKGKGAISKVLFWVVFGNRLTET